jgi:hypothetical protein
VFAGKSTGHSMPVFKELSASKIMLTVGQGPLFSGFFSLYNRQTGPAERLPFKKTASFLADCHALFSPEKGAFLCQSMTINSQPLSVTSKSMDSKSP